MTTEDNGHGNLPAEIFECIEQRLPEGWRFSSETALLEDGLSAFRKVREELRESLSAEVLPTYPSDLIPIYLPTYPTVVP